MLLFPQGKNMHEEVQVFVLLPKKVDYATEQQYIETKYKVELESGLSLSIYVYNKENWNKQFKNTPIYKKIQSEGIVL
nr:hypothetical protein [uncultured Carboxylicivirga sp.]